MYGGPTEDNLSKRSTFTRQVTRRATAVKTLTKSFFRSLTKKPTFQFRLRGSCRKCGRLALLLFSQIYWYAVDLTIFFFVFSSSFWHLMNVYSLGFNILAVVGLLLALVVVPSLLFIPTCQNFLESCFGLFASRLVSVALLACAFQVHETVRTMFIACCSGLALQRLWTIVRTSESVLWPHMHFVNYMSGLAFLLCLRSLFWSLHPLDIMSSTAYPIVFLGVAVFTAMIIFELAPTRETYINSETLGIPGNWLIKPEITTVMGISGTLGLASVLFLATYMFSSDAFIPRFTGFDPILWGPLVTGLVIFGCLIQLLFGVFAHTLHPVWDLILRFIMLAIFSVGMGLFMTVRVQHQGVRQLFPDGSEIHQFLENTVTWAYVGGCLVAASFPTVADIVASLFRHYFVTVKSHMKRMGVSILIGAWMFSLFIFHLSWFYPFISLFFSNERLVLLCITFPILLASLFGIVLRFLIKRRSKMVIDDRCATDEDIDEFVRTKCSQNEEALSTSRHSNRTPLETSWSLPKHKDSHLASSLAVLVSMFVLLLMPAVRQRTYVQSQRGSRLVSDKFSVVTHNIQMGLGLYGQGNVGFPTTDRFQEFDSFLHPQLWGLQETGTTNLLHLNRDFLSFFADSGRFFPYPGGPSYINAPGVAFLSSQALQNVSLTILPKGGGKLTRSALSANYPWSKYPADDPELMIRVVVVHLSNDSELARLAQIQGLRNILPGKGPLVILGDFNEHPEVVEPLLLKDTEIKRVPIDETKPTETAFFEHQDHIYYRDLCVVKCGIGHTVGVSDHLPVWAVFDKPNDNGRCPPLPKCG